MSELADLHLVRIALLLLAATAVSIYGWRLGTTWAARSWRTRFVMIGLIGVLGYIALGQVKASAYGLPVDGVTAVGGVSLSVLVSALVLLRSSSHEEA